MRLFGRKAKQVSITTIKNTRSEGRKWSVPLQKNARLDEKGPYKGQKGFAEKRYTWSILCQRQVHSKTNYISHARSPAIGQPHIVPVFGLKWTGTPGFV